MGTSAAKYFAFIYRRTARSAGGRYYPENIEIHHPGGGDPNFARIGLDELDKVPELPSNYPEFSMFKELPAWGFYLRHVKNLTMENIKLVAEKKDYRRAIVMDDVEGARIIGLEVKEPGPKKDPLFKKGT